MEVILPLRAVPQPAPALRAQGDCSACCLSGLTGLSLPEVYDQLLPYNTTQPEIIQGLYTGYAKGYFDRVIAHTPIWVAGYADMTWGLPSWEQAMDWWAYVTMGLDAGYYGLCSIDFFKQGPFTRTNHSVLIVGARERKPPPDREGRIYQDLLISCSTRPAQDEWVEVSEFLKQRGGFPVLLARPRKDR